MHKSWVLTDTSSVSTKDTLLSRISYIKPFSLKDLKKQKKIDRNIGKFLEIISLKKEEKEKIIHYIGFQIDAKFCKNWWNDKPNKLATGL